MHKKDRYGKELMPDRFHPKDFTDYVNAHVEQYLLPDIMLGPMIFIDPDIEEIRMDSSTLDSSTQSAQRKTIKSIKTLSAQKKTEHTTNI